MVATTRISSSSAPLPVVADRDDRIAASEARVAAIAAPIDAIDRAPIGSQATRLAVPALPSAPAEGAIDTDAIVDEAFTEVLGRPAGEAQFWRDWARGQAFEGRPAFEIDATLRDHLEASTERQVQHARALVDDLHSEILGRDTEGVGFWHDEAQQMIERGGSLDDVRAHVGAGLSNSTERKIIDAHHAVDDLHEELLGWRPEGKGWWHDHAKQIVEGGGSVDDARAAVRAGIRQSDEYRTNHPQPEASRSAASVAMAQPDGITCGPTSLTMALAHWGLGDVSEARVNQIARETRTVANGEFPGGPALIAEEARARGLQSEYSASRDVNALRATLQQGKGAIVNGSMFLRDGGITGHFVYVAGLDDRGRFIVNDPANGSSRAWSDAEMHAFTHRGANPVGYAAVWR